MKNATLTFALTIAAIVGPFAGAALGQIAALGWAVWAPRMAAELAALFPF